MESDEIPPEVRIKNEEERARYRADCDRYTKDLVASRIEQHLRRPCSYTPQFIREIELDALLLTPEGKKAPLAVTVDDERGTERGDGSHKTDRIHALAYVRDFLGSPMDSW